MRIRKASSEKQRKSEGKVLKCNKSIGGTQSKTKQNQIIYIYIQYSMIHTLKTRTPFKMPIPPTFLQQDTVKKSDISRRWPLKVKAGGGKAPVCRGLPWIGSTKEGMIWQWVKNTRYPNHPIGKRKNRPKPVVPKGFLFDP